MIHSGSPKPHHFAEVTRELQAEPPLTTRAKTGIAEFWLQVDDRTPKYEAWLGREKNLIHACSEASPRLKLATTEALLKHDFSRSEPYDDFKLLSYTVAEIIYWRRHLKDSLFIGISLSDAALQSLSVPIVQFEGLQEALLTWTPKTDPALMRASLSARLGQEKPHETQTPQPRADHP